MSAPSAALAPCPTCEAEHVREVRLGAARVLHCPGCDVTTRAMVPVMTSAMASEEAAVQRRSDGGRLRAACRRAMTLLAPPAVITAEGAWIPCPW